MISSEPSSQPILTQSSFSSSAPSSAPSSEPTTIPSSFQSSGPSGEPSRAPSSLPSGEPSSKSSSDPSSKLSSLPSSEPSSEPSSKPSSAPSSLPSFVSAQGQCPPLVPCIEYIFSTCPCQERTSSFTRTSSTAVRYILELFKVHVQPLLFGRGKAGGPLSILLITPLTAKVATVTQVIWQN